MAGKESCAVAAQAIGNTKMWRWRRRVATEQFSRLPAYDGLDEKSGSAVRRYWEPGDDVDLETEAGREEDVARRFVRSPSAVLFTASG